MLRFKPRPLTITLTCEPEKPPNADGDLQVICNRDGSLTIIADAETAARLAGRHEFGSSRSTRDLLRYRIKEAWYAAGCPQAS